MPVSHRMSHTATYTSWRKMVERCTNPRAIQFRYYGGRGIHVDPSWLGRGGFERFLGHVGERPEGTSIDRIDGSRGYEPGNVRWATQTDQCRNRSIATFITIGDETLCITEWCERIGLNYKTAHYRIKAGWDPAKAVTTPVLRRAS